MSLHQTPRSDKPPVDNALSLHWLNPADLIASGYDPEVVARLPVVQLGRDGRPCWHGEEIADLVALIARGAE